MRSLVSLTFDDGLRCQFEKALPILNRYGMRATFFLTANTDSTHDLWSNHTDDWWKIDWRADDLAMLKSVLKEGHEIGSHSVSHHPERLKMPEQADFEARESKTLIEHRIETKISSFCYPFYWSHGYLADAVKSAGYDQARGGGISLHYVPGNSYYSVSDPRALDRFNVDSRQITRHEDVAGWLRPGCWHVLTYHAVGNEKDGWEPITVEQFAAQIEELAGYRDSGRVEVLPFAQGAARSRNSAQA